MRAGNLMTVTGFAAALVVATLCQGQSNDIDVVALVKDVHQKELWIQQVDSLVVRLEGRWIKTPAGIQARRIELETQFPEMEEFDPRQFTGLRPEFGETLEIAFDANRLRNRTHWFGSRYELRIWDGQRAIVESGDAPGEVSYYALSDEPKRLVGDNLFGDLSWLRAAFPSFWWKPVDSEQQSEAFWGPIEDFELVDRQVYRGVDCYVLENHGGFRRWYVSVEGHFLCGFIVRVLTPQHNAREVIDEIARRRNKKFSTTRAFYEWRAQQPREERLAMDREYFTILRTQSRPQVEHFLSDYQEIAPGKWIPMTQGYEFYLEEPNEDGSYVQSSRRELRVTEVKLNEALPDEMFTLELTPGIRLNDFRYDFPLSYPYEPDMPQERWNTILTEARARHERWTGSAQAQDELIGQPAPPFPQTQWLNGTPLTWEDLRGQIVILDFWAEWCGPCRNDLPKMSELHQQRETTGITVLGIHTPGSEMEEIEKVTKLFDLRYPICIDLPRATDDAGWGRLFEQYKILGIPHAFVVDREGRIAGHGSLQHVLGVAQGLPVNSDESAQ